jgi:hypothetical protein
LCFKIVDRFRPGGGATACQTAIVELGREMTPLVLMVKPF